MNIYSKILVTILPLIFLNFAAAVGTTYYFSQMAIVDLADDLLSTKLTEAQRIAASQDMNLHKYNLEAVPASLQKAKSDASAAISQIEIGDSGYIFAVDKKGIVVLHPVTAQLGNTLKNTELFQRIKSGDKHLKIKFNGRKNIVAYTQFVPWGWTLISVIPEGEVFSTIYTMRPYLIAIGLGGSILVALILMGVARRITKPLRSLSAGVEKVSSGDFIIKIPIQSKDEIGKLSRGFNRMAQELVTLHHELEERVEQRTEELVKVNTELRSSIEEKEKAVAALQLNDRRMEAILRASPIGIGLIVNRRLEWANDVMYSIAGHDRDSLVDNGAEILYASKAEFERVGQLLYENISQKEIIKIETEWQKSSGALIDCSIRACPLDSEDLSKGLIIAVADITHTKRMEAKLQRAKKMEAIGTLAGGVAHDLNNILSGIVSYPELLLLDLPEESPMYKPLRTIQNSGEKAAVIVQDLLTMARRGVAVTKTLSLNEILLQLLEGKENKENTSSGISILKRLDEDVENISGSKVHLQKCMQNLIANSSETMENGGQIRISTENAVLESEYRGYEIIPKGSYAVFTVEDDGAGIKDADMEHLFEPFYTIKEMGRGGTGLGMAVVWGTVKDHSGYIDLESSESVGTTIRLFFPISREQLATSEDFDSIEMYKGAGEKVLVIDDSELQREIAGKILQRLNYSVDTVESGEEAVRYVEDQDVDILILDMIMPDGMDGLDTYRKIRDFKPEQRVIIASGFSETERVQEIQRLSGGPYLKKPYTVEILGKAVQGELQRT